MITSRAKWVAGILLSLLAALLACVGLGRLLTTLREGASQAPVRTLRVTIEEKQREQFFNQLKKFADNHEFQFELSDYATGGEHFQVWMLRDNVKIIAEDIPNAPTQISIGVYAESPDNPPPDEKIVDELLIDLRSFVSEIPNVTITEEK
jgi:hypothetical protein